MTNHGLKAWLDAMPIDDVRRKIERHEQKLLDLRALERLYVERNCSHSASEPTDPEAPSETAEEHGEGESEA